MRKKTLFRGSIAVSTAAILAAGVLGTPARAADPVTITIWTFGDVIQRQLVQEYKTLHPEITLQIKKSDLDPLNGTNMVTACTSKTGPDIVAVEVQYSGYWRSYPKCFTDLRKMKTSDTNVAAGVAADKTALDFKKNYLPWRWEHGVGYDDSVIGFPTDVGGLEVAYRVDLFKKAGKGFIDNAGTIYAAIMNQGTEKYYKNDGTDAGKLIYTTNPQVKKAWDTTIKATELGIGTRIGQYTSDWNIGMNKGTFATILAPAWMMDYIKQQAPDTSGKWDIAALPGGGGNQGGTQLTVPSYAKYPQEAYDFISWYLAPEQQLKVFKVYGLFPAASVLYDDAALLDYKDPFFNNAPVGKIYAAGVSKVKPIFEGKLQRAIDQAIGAGLGRVAAKKMTAKKSWDQVLADIKKVITN